jgi:alkyldihydroxyacetonephosphate synthase
MRRAEQVALQLVSGETREKLITDDSWRSPAHARLRWNGWGFADTRFVLNSEGQMELTGSRYLYSGKVMPRFREWIEHRVGLSLDETWPAQTQCPVDAPLLNHDFINEIKGKVFLISISAADRLDHGHGASFEDVYMLRYSKFPRVPDIVVYPQSVKEVELIVAAAARHNVVLIPYGGGTTVTHAVHCPGQEKRCIASLDMQEMNRVKWIDLESMEVCIEAGAVGVDIEKHLNDRGLCLGHEPDSNEFSTLGGWVSTRASGMKKNKYGNIEDLLLQVTIVTTQGTMVKSCHGPRMSTGIDINQIVLGSEGNFGVITEAVLKVCKLPDVRDFGSVIFPDFESGVVFMHEVGLRRCAPASIRLVDNEQFVFGQALKPANEAWVDDIADLMKKW